jgi:predicted phage terminase large subunit-like protein
LSALGAIDRRYKEPINRLPGIDPSRFIAYESKAEQLARLMVLRNAWIRKAREDFPTFMQYCFSDSRTSKRFRQQWFHDEWSWSWDRDPRSLIAAPRNHGKTSQIVGRTIWELGNDTNLRVKVACASDGRAKERLFEIDQNIKYNDRVKEVFPNLKPHPDAEWSKHKIVLHRTSRDKDASVEALGITSTATGGRADILIADDVVDRRNALSFPALRDSIKQAWLSDWTNLLEPNSKVWIICTLWHKDDLNHMLMDNPAYRVLLYAIDEKFGAMWPDKWPESKLRDRHKEIGTVEFNRGFRNQAIDLESAMVRESWFQFADLSKFGPFVERFDDLVFLCSYDTAGSPTGKKDQDFTSGTIIAVDPDMRKVYVVDSWHGRLTLEQSSKLVIREYGKYSPFRIFIEKIGQSSLDEWVLNKEPSLAGVIEVTKPKVSKAIRLLSVTPLMEAGNVVFAKHLDPNQGEWDPSRGSLVHELIDFPFGKHDDMCLAAGTLVATTRGNVPIENVRNGDKVLTPLGAKKVLNSGCTGIAETMTHAGVRGTHGHKIFAHGDGFVQMDACTQSMKHDRLSLGGLLRWNILTQDESLRWLSSTGSPTRGWVGREVITSASRERTPKGKTPKGCTLRSGRRTTKDKFRQAMSFTTRIATRLTMTLATWSAYRIRSIIKSLLSQPKCSSTSTPSGHRQSDGTDLKKERGGTDSTRQVRGHGESYNAQCAERLLSETGQSSALPSVDTKNEDAREDTTSRWNVSSAERSSTQSSRSIHPGSRGPARAHAAENSAGKGRGKEPVYNLTVEDAGCYYANGILVANCDSFSQALEGARRYFLDAWATGGQNDLEVTVGVDYGEDETRYLF